MLHHKVKDRLLNTSEIIIVKTRAIIKCKKIEPINQSRPIKNIKSSNPLLKKLINTKIRSEKVVI